MKKDSNWDVLRGIDEDEVEYLSRSWKVVKETNSYGMIKVPSNWNWEHPTWYAFSKPNIDFSLSKCRGNQHREKWIGILDMWLVFRDDNHVYDRRSLSKVIPLRDYNGDDISQEEISRLLL